MIRQSLFAAMQPNSRYLVSKLAFGCSLGFAGALGILALSGLSTAAQEPEHPTVTIRRMAGSADDPVKIVGFKLDGQSYDLSNSGASAPIHTTAGWLERLQIVVLNRSKKTVVAGTIQVTCPAVGHGYTIQSPRIFDQFRIGVAPDGVHPRRDPVESSSVAAVPISVGPGGKLIFVLQNDFGRMRKKMPEGGPTPDCTLNAFKFFFSDGMMWYPDHHFHKADPSSSEGYVSITAQEFSMDKPTE